jgi:uncharacterized membrane protein YidH (DUF202 family)
MPSLIDNPIAYAQFKLRGGWRNTLTVTSIYTAGLATLIVMTVRLNRPSQQLEILGTWSTGLLVIEAGLLLLFGASRISAAIRRDVTQGLMESHQLMPVDGFSAVFGYLIGAGAQAFVMAVATMLVGVFVAHWGGLDFFRFLAANASLVLFAVFVWVLSAFSAFLMKGGLGLFVGLVIGSMTLGQVVYMLLPGIRVLATPMLAGTVFSARTSFTFVPWSYAISVAAQAFVGAVCFVGAARKYRRGEDAALGPMLGLALLAGWVAISAIGIVYTDEFGGPFHLGDDGDHAQLVSAVLSAILLAIVPVASSAWAATEYHRHRLEEDPRPMRRPLSLWAVTAIAILLIAPLSMARGPVEYVSAQMGGRYDWFTVLGDPAPSAVLATSAVAGVFLIGFGHLLRFIYLATPKALAMGSVWLGGTWLLPLLIDYMIAASRDYGDPAPSRVIASISPIGAVMQIWDANTDGSYAVGLVAQLALAAFPILLYRRAVSKVTPPPASALPAPSAS